MGQQAETLPIVHIVDDDDGIRDSLRFALESEGLAVKVYDSALAILDDDLPVTGCVLTDFHMPGTNGLQLQAELTARGVRLPVILMTAHGEVPIAVRAMRAGALDFLEKPFEDNQLLDAIQRAINQSLRTQEATVVASAAARKLDLLTPREQEVLDLLVTGKSNKAMGNILGTSPRTIDVHRARVFQKLQVESLPELVHLVLAARAAGEPS